MNRKTVVLSQFQFGYMKFCDVCGQIGYVSPAFNDDRYEFLCYQCAKGREGEMHDLIEMVAESGQ